jgi:hypothetical protein
VTFLYGRVTMPIQNQQSFVRQSILEARREASRALRPLQVSASLKRESHRNGGRWREARKIPIAGLFCDSSVVLDTRNVAILADSFRQAGQTSAILVVHGDDESFRVVSGAHRVAAAKELGWGQIDAIVLDCDERGQRLIEIAENLHRRDLSVLQRAELQNEWIGLIRREAVQNARPSGGRQPKERGLGKAARALGVSKEETMRASRIASISPEAKEKARELGFEDNQSTLLSIAKATTPEAQIALLYNIAERKKAPRKGSASRNEAVEAKAQLAGVSITSLTAQAPEGEPDRALQKREDVSSASPELSYPDLPRGLERRPVDAQVEALTEEWRSSRLRKMLGCAPLEARERFITEILCPEFPDTFVTALRRHS